METWNYAQPVRIVFGAGKVKSLPDEIKKFGGRRGVLVTSPSFVKRGVVQQLVSDSGGLLVDVYSSVSPNPDVRECDACCEVMRRAQADFVVAMGGGSVLDCAKAAAVFALAEAPALAYLNGSLPIPARHLPLIAVPTTAGTGSEITCVSVLSDHERGIKAPLSADSFYPTLALVDSQLTLSVPRHLTACTGFDVLCHATEAYWSRWHQPICDALAVHAARLVLANLQAVVNDGSNAVARDHMAEASVIAGLAFTQPKTTSAHACSYALTRLLDIPHGEACALTIDHFMRINLEHGCERIDTFARLLGYADGYALADAYTALKRATGVRCGLTSYHLDEEQIEALVKASQHPNLKNNPVEITPDMLHALYERLSRED